jgi:hypothetical protein
MLNRKLDFFIKTSTMSLQNQNNPKKGKKGNKNQKNSLQGSKFIPKPGPGKSGGFSQRPHKAGGTRGS